MRVSMIADFWTRRQFEKSAARVGPQWVLAATVSKDCNKKIEDRYANRRSLRGTALMGAPVSITQVLRRPAEPAPLTGLSASRQTR